MYMYVSTLYTYRSICIHTCTYIMIGIGINIYKFIYIDYIDIYLYKAVTGKQTKFWIKE
jgi:hypothetical protein